MPARDDLALLIDVARAAGEIALRYWKKSPEVWEKEAGAGPVTAADLAVNQMMLAELLAARPDHGWLSEETPDNDERLHRDSTFIIDPIDGTRAFIEGSADFAHSLALAHRGQITAAVVYLPAKDRLYAATAGEGATCNGNALRASSVTDPVQATLLTARANMAPEHWQGGVPPPVKRMFRASIAYRLCLVAEGAFDAMLTTRPTWEWDVAAGALIARQAGAVVSDRLGEHPRFNRTDPRLSGCLAAPPALHARLLSQLAR